MLIIILFLLFSQDHHGLQPLGEVELEVAEDRGVFLIKIIRQNKDIIFYQKSCETVMSERRK